MSFNNSIILILSLLISPVVLAATEEAPDLDELVKNVPESVLERQKEIERLKHLSSRFAEMASIEQSRALIRDAKKPPKPVKVERMTGDHAPSFIEQQVVEAMKGNPLLGVPSQKKEPKKNTFSASIALISLWGDPKNPTADVIIDKRSTDISKGSVINGWSVRLVTKEFVEVARGKNVSRVYYTDSAGEE